MILSFLKKNYLAIAIIIFGILILYRPPVDPDFGWHFKYGEYIYKNHQLLKENIFSYTFADYKWANSYWLSELYIYFLTTTLGVPALALINSIAFSIIAYWLISKCGFDYRIKVISLLLLFTTISVFSIIVRPMFFSSIFFLLIIYVLLYKPKATIFFPLIFLIWSNLHPDYVPALGIYGVYSFIDLINSVRDKKFNLFRNILIPLASALATLINPYTISLWTTLIKESNSVMVGNVSEFLPLSLSTYTSMFLLIYILSGLILSSVVMYRNKNNIWYSIVLSVFFLLSLRSIYFFRILIIIGVFGFCKCWGFILENILKIHKRLLNVKAVILTKTIFLFSLLFAVIVFGSYYYQSLSLERWSVAEKFPYGAINYIKEERPFGNMFNNYSWGGYLIWQLPEYKTYIDGRMPSWRENGEFLFKDYVDITNDPEKNFGLFNKYVEEYNIGWVLDKKDSKLTNFLKAENSWTETYSDDYSVVLLNNSLLR